MAVLREIHDAGEALNLLNSGCHIAELPTSLVSQVHDVVIEVRGFEVNERQIRMLALSEGAADVIEFFKTPRSRRQFIQRFASMIADVESSFDQLKETVICPPAIADERRVRA